MNLDPSQLLSFSIVVPNFNGGKTLLETLQSLIEQDYPKLEIIVVDGGSTDDSVEVIKQFEPHIAWWVSEPDKGQSDAINKGFARCTGDIVNWLCSDDILTPDALKRVNQHFSESPEVDVVVGRCRTTYAYKDTDYIAKPTLQAIALMPAASNAIAQPSCFYRRRLLDRPHPIDESYYYTMDFELWNYFKSQGVQWKCIEDELSVARQDGLNKSSTGGYKVTLELERVYRTYVSEWIPLIVWHRRLRYPLERFLALHPHRAWVYIIGPLWLTITVALAPFYGFRRVWAMRWKRWA